MHDLYLIILVFALNIYSVTANPVPPRNLELLLARADGSNSNDQILSPKTWVMFLLFFISVLSS